MTICQPCKDEADGVLFVLPEEHTCSTCGRVVKVNKGGKLRKHYAPADSVRKYGVCHGSMMHLVGGHLACEGCPCMHKPKGSWNG